MEQGRGKCLDGGKCECSEGWIGATCESPVVEVSYPETDEGRRMILRKPLLQRLRKRMRKEMARRKAVTSYMSVLGLL